MQDHTATERNYFPQRQFLPTMKNLCFSSINKEQLLPFLNISFGKYNCFLCICRECSKSHCLSEASLRFFRMVLADFQTLRVPSSRNRTENNYIFRSVHIQKRRQQTMEKQLKPFEKISNSLRSDSEIFLNNAASQIPRITMNPQMRPKSLPIPSLYTGGLTYIFFSTAC